MVRGKYWYRMYIGECPVCGSDKSYRERVYDKPRPEGREDRYIQIPYSQIFDWCV